MDHTLLTMKATKRKKKKKKAIRTKREKSKQRNLKWKTMEMEDFSELCTEKENVDSSQEKTNLSTSVLENDLSFKKNKKAKKNKIHSHNVENLLSKKKCKKNNPCKNPSVSLDSIYFPATGKKAKEDKQSQGFINLCLSKSKCREIKHEKSWKSPKPVQTDRSQMKQQRLYKYLCYHPSRNSSFIEENEQTIDVCCEDVSTFKGVCPAELLEPAFQSSDLGDLETHQKTVPAFESVEDDGHKLKACPYNTEPSQSPATTPHIKPGGLESELCVEDPKHAKPLPLKPEEACSSADLSQDLFITQKSFGPVQISSTDSCSSFQSYSKETNAEQDHHTSTDRMEWYSQAPSKKLKAIERCHTSENKLSFTNRKKRILTTDKSTQTDDFLSCPILASSISHAKRFTSCSVQPLDLSLPCRVRACSLSPKQASCPVSEESKGIHRSPKLMQDPILCTEEQLPNSKTLSIAHEREREKRSFSQSRKSEEGKFVQMLLNSSYFFKGKGEVGIDAPMVPLLKQKAENEKRSSGGNRRQRTKSGSRLQQ
uniref:Uncharacterized protein LOC117351970 n=1 Tax=Geotrypetes seraphini TaxID=260995 RepID=A0A6P8PIU3_GEOSA|nr:uncharacterized protein LOC117351970 [Geotrypetes seraphini]XP_033783783.1 uncharacterized protein LOC117351970 [Geotrypetes seraphini]XP_033783784.1 uncharacterized protein LOC117351970 [Geotrypetes seraphini]